LATAKPRTVRSAYAARPTKRGACGR
jgi:hypothetical protein